MNPTTQFHPYQRETSVPVADRPETGFNGFLNKVGIDPTSLKSLDKVRAYAKANPAKVLGGLAAIAIGVGLLRGRRVTR
ncbi:MAG TPA: hypothetical protein VF713_04130 [Thermoanaerobaculia bacterium]